MITIEKGNIFLTEKKVIVNTINCVGAMGKGLALECRLRYPDMYRKYKELCKTGLISPGLLWIYKINKNRWILNFPTKTHWKYPSKEIYIINGLRKFINTYEEKNIESAAFPILGTYNGGLNKDRILNIMTQYLSQCYIPISIYEYDPTAPDEIIEHFKEKWKSLTINEKINIFGKSQFEKINKVITDNIINSIINIYNIDNTISKKSLEICYKL